MDPEKRGYRLQEFVAHDADVRSLAIGKKSSRVFITGGNDRKVNLWAIGKQTPLLSLSGHTSAVEVVQFDSAEMLVLAGSSNGSIKLWDLEEAKSIHLTLISFYACWVEHVHFMLCSSQVYFRFIMIQSYK